VMRDFIRRKRDESADNGFSPQGTRELALVPHGAPRVLLVCSANVSRSPLAAEILRRRLADRSVQVHVASAGIASVSLDVDALAVQAGFEHGVDISEHRPRMLTRSILDQDGADLVIGMTREHVREVVLLDSQAWERTFTLKELARRIRLQRDEIADDPARWAAALGARRVVSDLLGAASLDDVADPYRKTLAAHQRVAQEISIALNVIVEGLLVQMVRQ
jgi:protein-tyrosine phosphatase